MYSLSTPICTLYPDFNWHFSCGRPSDHRTAALKDALYFSNPKQQIFCDGQFLSCRLRDLVEGQSGIVVLGDKGYVGEALMQDMASQEIWLMALKRSNSKTGWPKSVRQLIFKQRRRVETVFSQLSGQLNVERRLGKSFQDCVLGSQIFAVSFHLIYEHV